MPYTRHDVHDAQQEVAACADLRGAHTEMCHATTNLIKTDKENAYCTFVNHPNTVQRYWRPA